MRTGAFIGSAFDVAGIVAVRVRLPDPPIPIVDFQLGIGITADLAAATASAHILSAIRIWNDMMGPARILSFGHHILLVS
jgi:hypothetical protein